MGTDSRRSTIAAAVFAVIVIALLVSGGLYVRTLITESFKTSSDLAAEQMLTINALRYQLDEETGLRGFADTHDRVYLESFNRGKSVLHATIAELRANLIPLGLGEAVPYADDLAWVDRHYIDEVAGPLLQSKSDDTNALERLGKRRTDRFRTDIRRIVEITTRRAQLAGEHVRASTDHIRALVGAAVVLVLIVSLLFTRQQAALAARDVVRAAYVAEKRIADTLQEAFVQRPLPAHPGLRFSAIYVPAGEEAKVGGDWYDALELPANRVLFTIGDVTGHGITAAVTMNRVRQALISAALLDAMPAAMLGRVARELIAAQSPLVTALAGFADANACEFVYASAGHPPPLLLEPGRPPRFLDYGSLPLGTLAGDDYRTFRIQTVPGAMLVLYTDGAIEHSHDIIEGERMLLAAATDVERNAPPDPAAFIHRALFDGRDAGDDVAILTIGFA